MKKLLFLFYVLLISMTSYSQSIDRSQLPRNSETNLIEYTDLVIVDSSITQNELYVRTKEWFVNSFKSSNDVIQMDNKESGIIIGKGNFLEGRSCRINFTLKVQVKDGKYKYWFSNFEHNCSPYSGYNGGLLENEKPDCGYMQMAKREWIIIIPTVTDQNIKSMIKSLNNSLSKKLNNDNW